MQQVTAGQAAPAAPQAPASPVPVPTSRQELDALQFKRAELTNQMQGLTDRRRELARQREQMRTEERAGHNVRIQAIDERSAQVEAELLQTDQAIAQGLANGITVGGGGGGPARVFAGTQPDRQLINAVRGEIEDSIYGALATGTFTLLGIYVVWRGFRRFVLKKKPIAAKPIADQTPRLDQLQQSIDVIALEVERISEAQRFVAKVLNEKLPALGAGAAQPVSGKARDELRADR